MLASVWFLQVDVLPKFNNLAECIRCFLVISAFLSSPNDMHNIEEVSLTEWGCSRWRAGFILGVKDLKHKRGTGIGVLLAIEKMHGCPVLCRGE